MKEKVKKPKKGSVKKRKAQGAKQAWLHYDHYVQVQLASSVQVDIIKSWLLQGLGNRIKSLEVWTDESESGDILAHVALRIDNANASRVVDRGPSPQDEKSAKAFKEFWGEKAELRRFKDGEILESVAWEDEGAVNLETRTFIPIKAVQYVLTRHLGPDIVQEFKSWGNDLVNAITLPDHVASTSFKSLTSSPFQNLQTSFDQLAASLRALDDLPLRISAILPIGPPFTYSLLFGPYPSRAIFATAHGPSSYAPSHSFVIQFESSTQWPDDLIAIQKLKLAFLHRMALSINNSVRGAQARIRLLDAPNQICDQAELQIVTDTGYCFRGRIERPRDQQLMLKRATDPLATASQIAETEVALQEWRRAFVLVPKHTRLIHSLVLQYPSLAQSIRITKRWFANHLLSNHVTSEVIELIVASIYVNPSQDFTEPPATGITGFARVLYFLARWDWIKEPLIIGMPSGSGAPTADSVQMEKVLQQFQATRSSDPGLYHAAFFITTIDDPTGRSWTWDRPSRVTAGRICTLAKACIEHWERSVIPTSDSTSLSGIFQPPLNDYDFLIHLKVAHNTRSYQSMHLWDQSSLLRKRISKTPLMNGHVLSDKDTPLESNPILDFDPVSDFVKDLETVYGDSMMLFYDAYGGPVIGGLFDPILDEPRRWKVNLDYNSMVDEESGQVVLNKKAIVYEIERLGQDLVERIEIQWH